MDYTPGGFRNVRPDQFQIRNALPFVQTTRAHGLAMYVVYDSPLGLVSDSPDTYAASPAGLDVIAALPTSWDETRFVGGTVGDYVAVARRKGRSWYVGALNNETARNVRIALAFLGKGRFAARLVGDGATPSELSDTRRPVSAAESLSLNLAATGGAVVLIEPGR
jgi:alpha-glucosidase